jgi:hypothetical protein
MTHQDIECLSISELRFEYFTDGLDEVDARCVGSPTREILR